MGNVISFSCHYRDCKQVMFSLQETRERETDAHSKRQEVRGRETEMLSGFLKCTVDLFTIVTLNVSLSSFGINRRAA